MAKYNNPKTGKTTEAKSAKEARKSARKVPAKKKTEEKE